MKLGVFLNKLLRKWIIYLGLLPLLYDLISAYFSIEFSFSKDIVSAYVFLVFLIAVFSVWKDEYEARRTLEEKLLGPTDFRIEMIITHIDFQVEKLISHIGNIEQEVTEKLKNIPKLLPVSKIQEQIGIHTKVSLMGGFPHDKSPEKYNQELKLYANELQHILENIDNYKESIINMVGTAKGKYFLLSCYIENTGTIADSNIQVDIQNNTSNLLFKKGKLPENGMNIFEFLPTLPKQPTEPKPKTIYDIPDVSSARDRLSEMKLNFPNIESPHAMRTNMSLENNSYSVTIKELRVGDRINLLEEDIILLKNEDIHFDAVVKSKESKRVLQPMVSIILTEEEQVLY